MAPPAFLAVVALVALVSGCGSSGPSGTADVVLHTDANGRSLTVSVGQTVEVLVGDMTAGGTYWDLAPPSDASVLMPVGKALLATCPDDVPGEGCGSVGQLYRAVSAGQAVLSASRTTCGEVVLCAPDKSHFSVTISVK